MQASLCANPSWTLRTSTLIVAVIVSFLSCGTDQTYADVIQHFETVAGQMTGEFAWDDFGTTGSPYQGPHTPDQFSIGSGTATFSSNAGGMITGTNNLYSFFSVPQWSLNLSGLDSADPFTSLAVQFAVSTSYTPSQFTINGVTPDEFVDLGQRAEIGGFPYNFYWAEWQGLTSSSSYTIQLQGTGQHQSLAGTQVSYVNSSSPANLFAVPEPSSVALFASVLGFAFVRRRRK